MDISRVFLTEKIERFLVSDDLTVCVLYGPRQVGKSTVLTYVYEHLGNDFKKIFYSFDQEVVPKQFLTIQELLDFMLMKYGFDPFEKHLLFLNETQYSQNLRKLLQDYALMEGVKGKIIATGILPQDLYTDVRMMTLEILPLTFHEFLSYRRITFDHVGIETTSKIILKELQKLYDEYLVWGGYPTVVTSGTNEQKMLAVKTVIQMMYEKDIGFFFNGEDMLAFNTVLYALYYAAQTVFKLTTLGRYFDVKKPLLQRYIQFLVENQIIALLPFYHTGDKKKEIHYQKKLVFLDEGIMTYITKDTNSKLTTNRYQQTFIYRHLLECLEADDMIYTYKKVNGSSIDFIVKKADGSLILIFISDEESVSCPKIVTHFSALVGAPIRGVIKTSRLKTYIAPEKKYPFRFLIVPPFLITKAYMSVLNDSATNH